MPLRPAVVGFNQLKILKEWGQKINTEAIVASNLPPTLTTIQLFACSSKKTNHSFVALRGYKMILIEMDKLAERCDEDDRFCVVCLRTRNDVPVIDHCCYSCGGEGQEVLLQ